jgi:hypothetical protein
VSLCFQEIFEQIYTFFAIFGGKMKLYIITMTTFLTTFAISSAAFATGNSGGFTCKVNDAKIQFAVGGDTSDGFGGYLYGIYGDAPAGTPKNPVLKFKKPNPNFFGTTVVFRKEDVVQFSSTPNITAPGEKNDFTVVFFQELIQVVGTVRNIAGRVTLTIQQRYSPTTRKFVTRYRMERLNSTDKSETYDGNATCDVVGI